MDIRGEVEEKQEQKNEWEMMVEEEEKRRGKKKEKRNNIRGIETADANSCNIEKMEMANPVRDDPTTAWAWHQVLEPTGCGSALMNGGAIADLQ